jgi:hypothetical protein
MAKAKTIKLVGTGKPKLNIPSKLTGSSVVATSPISQNFVSGWEATHAPAAVNPWDAFYKTYASTIQTPAQIQAEARKTALANETAAAAAATAASNKIISQYNQQADRAQGMAQALAQIQSEQGNQAAASYNTAANTLTGLGTGLTGAVSDAYQSQIDNARSQIAAITGGLGTVSAPEAGDMRNAAQYAGVTIPATTIASDAFNAKQLALNAAHAGQTNVDIIGQNYRAQANQQVGKAAEDMRALIAGRPKSIQDLVTSLTANRTAGIQNLATVLGQRATFAQAEQKRRDDLVQQQYANQLSWGQYQTQRDYLRNQTAQTQSQIDTALAGVTGYDPKTGLPTFANQQAKRTFLQNMAQLATSKSNGLGYQVEYDPKTNTFVTKYDKKGHVMPIGGYVLNPKDKTGQSVIPFVKPGTGTKDPTAPGTGGMTLKDWNALNKDASTNVAEWLKGEEPDYQFVPPQFDDDGKIRDGTGITVPVGPGKPGMDYGTLLTNLQDMNESPRWQRRALEIANRHFDPGEAGRPWGTGKVAMDAITKTAKLNFKNQVNFNLVMTELLKEGFDRAQVLKGLKGVYGNIRNWQAGPGVTGGPGHKPTDAGARGGATDVSTDTPESGTTAPSTGEFTPGTKWSGDQDPIKTTWDPTTHKNVPITTKNGAALTVSGHLVRNGEYVRQ